MTWNRMLHVVVWLVAVTALAAVQTATPDFSGRWVLESAEESGTDVAKALSINQSLVRTEVRGEPTTFQEVAVVRDFAAGSQTETYRIGVSSTTLPGSRRGESKGPVSYHRVAGQNTTLVIESGSYTGPAPKSGQWTERRETWSFDAVGRLRLTITTQGSDRSPATVVRLYRRGVIAGRSSSAPGRTTV